VAPTLVLVAVSFVLWLRSWVGLRLKQVETDGVALVVSGAGRTDRVPLEEVVSVQRVWWLGPQRIFLEVGREPASRRQIVFEAPFEAGAILGPHRLVRELRGLVAQARAFAEHPRSGPPIVGVLAGAPGDHAIGRVRLGSEPPRRSMNPAELRSGHAPSPAGPPSPVSSRWPLSRGGGMSWLGLGCLGVFCLGVAGIGVATAQWWAIGIPLVILMGNLWRAFPLARAETDGRTLFLERRGRMAAIPLTEVANVDVELFHGYRRALRISFRQRTPLGRWVVIEPAGPIDWFATAYDGRDLRELRQLVAGARDSTRSPH